MTYCEFLPCEEVRDYIKCYWFLDSAEQAVNLKNKIIPFGCVDLIFQKKPVVYYYVESDKQRIQLPQFIIAPVPEKAFDIQLTGNVNIFGIRVQPYAAKSIFKTAITELNNTIWPVRNILGKAYHSLGESLIALNKSTDIINTANNFFQEQLRDFQAIDYVVKNICRKLTDLQPGLRLKDIFQKYNVTEQGIRLRFERTVGVTPKCFQKLVRINYALSLKLYKMKMEKNMTRIALQSGYYDQAHFIREFQQVLKFTPGSFLENSFPITQFYLNPDHYSYLLNAV